MFKISLILFVLNALALVLCVALMIPIAWWQWAVAVGLGSVSIRSWLANQAEEEKLDATYSHYRAGEGRKKKKAPTYHEL